MIIKTKSLFKHISIIHSQYSTQRRVVITGLGCVTPLGCNAEKAYQNLIKGHSGLVNFQPKLNEFENTSQYLDFNSKVAGKVPTKEFNPNQYLPFDTEGILSSSDKRAMPLFIQYAIHATQQALESANITEITEDMRKTTGVCYGSGIGSLMDTVTTWENLRNQKPNKVSPFYVPRILTNMAAGHISMRWGFEGPNHSVATACTTGAHSIGDAFRFIQYGDADRMIAGSSEASLNSLAFSGFSRAKSLATKYNSEPTKASRPFDKDRDGFVIGEGAATLILEELNVAKQRGAKIYGEIIGYGLSGDAYHLTAPPDSGHGAKRAMLRALETAKVQPEKIGYVNAHATSTLKGDAIENKAILEVFRNHTSKLAVSSNKGAIGHLLGAAGAVETLFTILTLYHGVLPPTLNLENLSEPKEDFPLNYVPLKAQKVSDLKFALTNSFGFGGTNASLCLKKFED